MSLLSFKEPSSSRPAPALQTGERRREFGGMKDIPESGSRFGSSRVDYEKYTVYGFAAAFAVMLLVAYYLREDSRQTRQMDYASLTFLGLAALATGYKGLYKAYDKKNIYTLLCGVASLLFVAQAYYVYEARDDIDGTVSLEQDRSTKITYGGALVGLIGAGYLALRSRQ
jgi:hypothetical protein